jgi:hypothetical protein
MAAGNTYESIATYTTTGTPTTYTMSSIPSNYTDIVLVGHFHFDGPSNFTMWVNGDTSSIYSTTNLGANGSTASGGRQTGVGSWLLSYQIGAPTVAGTGHMVAHFQNYSNTNINKAAIIRMDAGAATYPGTQLIAGLYRSNSAISSITISGNSGTTVQAGSTFTIYGIRAA